MLALLADRVLDLAKETLRRGGSAR